MHPPPNDPMIYTQAIDAMEAALRASPSATTTTEPFLFNLCKFSTPNARESFFYHYPLPTSQLALMNRDDGRLLLLLAFANFTLVLC